MVVNNSVYCASPCFLEAEMEGIVEENKVLPEEIGEGFVGVIEEECRESSSSSDFLVSEATVNEEHSHSSSEDSSSPPSMSWPVQKPDLPHCSSSDVSQGGEKPHLDERKLVKQGSTLSGIHCIISISIYKQMLIFLHVYTFIWYFSLFILLNLVFYLMGC